MAFDLTAPISMPQLIERATTSMLVAPDWTINIQICDMCGRDAMLAKEAAALVKKKLKEKSTTSAVFALHLLEALMKNAWYVIPHVHAKEYLATLARIVKDKKTKYQVRDKLADLIQSWGIGLQSSTRFPDFFMTYQSLKHAGIRFHPPQNDYVEPPMPAGARRSRAPIPPVSTASYRVSTGAPSSGGSPSGQRRVYVDQYGQRYVASTAPPRAITSHEASLYGMSSGPSSSPARETKGQRTIRIRNQFEGMKTKIQLLEEMLNCTPPSELYSNDIISEIWPSCHSYIRDINNWIEEGNMDEVLLAELLSVHDQINGIEKKYEEMARLASLPPGASEFTPSLILDVDGPSSSSSAHYLPDSDDESDLSLPPPPGQRTPPLLLDGFVSRPIATPTSTLPPLSSLEEFLSLPPVTSATSSSSPFLSTATSSSSSSSSSSSFYPTTSISSPMAGSTPVFASNNTSFATSLTSSGTYAAPLSSSASFAAPPSSSASFVLSPPAANPGVYAGIPLQSGSSSSLAYSQIPVGLNPSTFSTSSLTTSAPSFSAPSFSASSTASPLTADIFSSFAPAHPFTPGQTPSPFSSPSPAFPPAATTPLDPAQLNFPSTTPTTTPSLFPNAPTTTPSPFSVPSTQPALSFSSEPTTPFNPWGSQTSTTTSDFNPFGL